MAAAQTQTDSDPKRIIRRFKLKTHPEGGYYRETFRCPKRANGRNLSTQMLYLLRRADVSRFHRLTSDEIWHYYSGGTLALYELETSGRCLVRRLGPATQARRSPQLLIRAGRWFAAEVLDGTYSLVGCSVSPGFDFRDFEMGRQTSLLKRYPAHAKLIRRFS